MLNKIKIFLLLALSGVLITGPVSARERPEKTLDKAIGINDSIIVKNARTGDILFSKNCDKPLVPASIIKVVTSLAAMHYLGEDYHFVTECYQRRDGALILKGYGDPFFVSEEIDLMAEAVSRIVRKAPKLVVDYSYFTTPEGGLPGRTPDSLQPYDSPAGALCANFNTVAFTRKRGRFISAEKQTPLLPFALERIEASGVSRGRIMMIQNQREAALYAGELCAYFLGVHGCTVDGPVVEGRVNQDTDRLVYRYVSRKTLRDIVNQLLLFSSNFMANQLMLCCGVKKYGPPATHSKGLQALQDYLRQDLGIQVVKLAEGAGLSKDTRVSARTMCRVLDAFAPYHVLMRRGEDNEFYKTGSLTDVSTRAGYILTRSGMFQFVIMSNTPGKKARRLMPVVKRLIRSMDK